MCAKLIGFEEDIEREFTRIHGQIDKSLQYVGAEMQSDLIGHIQNDVLKAYTPSIYVRRTTSTEGKSGIPIESEKNIDITVENHRLTLSYEPESERTPWNKPIKGDMFISVIEEGTGYNWNGKVPKRPFWQLFKDEMDEKAEGIFEKGMRPYKIVKN